LYRKAAEQGTIAAQFTLGVSYETGSGASKDLAHAHLWFNLAALSDNSPSLAAFLFYSYRSVLPDEPTVLAVDLP
jgi:TPR repeat protein